MCSRYPHSLMCSRYPHSLMCSRYPRSLMCSRYPRSLMCSRYPRSLMCSGRILYEGMLCVSYCIVRRIVVEEQWIVSVWMYVPDTRWWLQCSGVTHYEASSCSCASCTIVLPCPPLHLLFFIFSHFSCQAMACHESDLV